MMIYSINKEEQVMDPFQEQMWMCDFAAKKEGCPEGDHCFGPDGTRITPSRLYSFEQWSIQKFVKSALLDIFPEHAAAIDAKVDPGEYGVESQECRWLSSILFIVAVMCDFRDSMSLLRLLWRVPSAEESWVQENAEGEVELQICGMPRLWKAINLVLVMIPKLVLWEFTCRTGMVFLLDTASIDNVIINATALVFILDIDELFFYTFSSERTVSLMNLLQGYNIDEESTQLTSEDDVPNSARSDGETGTPRRMSSANLPDADKVQRIFYKSAMNRYFSITAIPFMVVLVVMLWCGCVYSYYQNHCQLSADGTWVSLTMFEPKSTQYSHLSALLPTFFPIEREDVPYWTWKEPET